MSDEFWSWTSAKFFTFDLMRYLRGINNKLIAQIDLWICINKIAVGRL